MEGDGGWKGWRMEGDGGWKGIEDGRGWRWEGDGECEVVEDGRQGSLKLLLYLIQHFTKVNIQNEKHI